MENSNFEDKTKEDICQLKIMVDILKYLNIHTYILSICIYVHNYVYLYISNINIIYIYINNYYYNFKIINFLK